MGDMPEQRIMCPNCTKGCKLIKLCFIEETGGGGVEYRSNINKELEWFVLNRLSDTEVWSLLLSPLFLNGVWCLCIPVCPPLFWLDVSNVKTDLRPVRMKQVASVEIPSVILPVVLVGWVRYYSKWASWPELYVICMFVQIHTTHLYLCPRNWTFLLL